ncbi:MAG TPA: PDZ domain-containing protein, partial [Rhodanobacteraceae bacterium]|nr:PDZ domain-containing protein [Rhodanobacteraceae bacterium]
LIGYEMLRRFVTRIDYDKKLLTLTLPAHFDPHGTGHALTLHFDGRTPQVNAVVDGAPGLFLVDTGSNAELILTEGFAAEHAIHLDGHLRDGVVAGVGGALHDRNGTVGTFQLGGYTLPHFASSIVQSATGALAPASGLAGNIGGRVLSHFVVTFDYPQRRMYLRQGAHFQQAASRKADAGIGLSRIDHHTLQVIAVDAHSPAARAGVKVGDRIVAIDGIPVSNLGLDQIEAYLKGPSATALTLTLRKNDHRTKVLKLMKS